jgi:tetratricopeptide (TPR) repeat protein
LSDVLSRQFPPPLDWQAFERLCFDLYSRIWQSNDAEMHGRRGQPQAGVDVYGRDRIEGKFVGVQCKGKDAGYGAALSKPGLLAEVEKAKTFKPPLEVFVVATSGPNDVKLQKVARELSQAHAACGLFEVRVQGWDTLKQRISDHPDLLNKHFHDLAPLDLLERFERTETRIDGWGGRLEAGISDLAGQADKIQASLGALTRQGDAWDPLEARIEPLAALIGQGEPRAALRGLEGLLASCGATASVAVRFLIRGNMGAARLALGDKADAIADFRAAAAAEPASARGLGLLATAEILAGDLASARRHASEALALDPTARRAAMVSIDAAPPGASAVEIEMALPQALRGEVEIQIGLSLRAQQMNDIDGALMYAERAYAQAPEDWRTNSAVAEVLLTQTASQTNLAAGGAVGDQVSFQRALDLLRSSWVTLRARADASRGAHVAANLICALDLANEDAEREEVLNQALVVAPDYLPLLRRRAQRMMDAGDWAGLEPVLAKIPPEETEDGDRLAEIQLKIHTGRAEDALALAHALEKSAKASGHLLAAAALAIEAAHALGTVETELPRVLAAYSRAVLPRAVALLCLPPAHPLRPQLIDAILSLASETSDPMERLHAADALGREGRYESAADLYAMFASPLRDSPVLIHRLEALHLSDRRREARELFEAIPESLRDRAHLAQIGAAIFEKAGLIPRARELLEHAMAAAPDSLRLRLAWVGLCQRSGDESTAAAWLVSVTPDVDGSADDLIRLARAISRLAPDFKYLQIAYRALRAGYGDPQIHLGYTIGLFVTGGVPPEWVRGPSRVEADSVVILRQIGGDRRLIRVLESEPQPSISRDEIATDSELAQALVGLACGERVELSNLGTDEAWFEVEEIRNKYLHAHLVSLDRFEDLFPGHKGMGRVRFPEKPTAADFEPIFKMLRARAKSGEVLIDAYIAGKLPLALFAKISGGSIFDLWEAVHGNERLGVLMAVGAGEELKVGLERARCAELAVVDPVTLWGLRRLGLEARVLSAFPRVGLVQGTVDLLRELVQDRRESVGRKQGTMSWVGDSPTVIEVDNAWCAARLAEAEDVLAFAETLEILPAEASAALAEEARPILARLPSAFVDTIYAAQTPGRVLLSDDRVFRGLSEAAGGVSGVWSQVALQAALSQARITIQEYADGVLALVEAAYSFTSLSTPVLMHALKAANWRIEPRVEKLFLLVARPSNEPESVKRLLTDILALAFTTDLERVAFCAIASALLQAFKAAQPDRDLRLLVADIRGRLRNRLLSHVRVPRSELLNSTYLISVEFRSQRSLYARLSILEEMTYLLERARADLG